MNCSNCKAEIQEVYIKCPSCGHKLKSSSSGCLKALGIGAAIFVGLAVIGSFLPKDNSAPSSTPVVNAVPNTPNPPTIRASAREIFRAYEANEASAQKKFGDRPVEVTGKISGITLDFSDDPVVQLTTDNPFMSMQLAPDDHSKSKASDLKKGQNLTAICQNITELAGTPMASDCRF